MSAGTPKPGLRQLAATSSLVVKTASGEKAPLAAVATPSPGIDWTAAAKMRYKATPCQIKHPKLCEKIIGFKNISKLSKDLHDKVVKNMRAPMGEGLLAILELKRVYWAIWKMKNPKLLNLAEASSS